MGYPIGGFDVYERIETPYEGDQVNVPICYVPPTCTLNLLTAVPTAPSLRGASDGTIACTFSSTSGSTATYYLNGVSKGVHGTGYTFTGLTQGIYNVRIVQTVCEDSINNIIVPDGEFRTGNFATTSPQSVSAVENPIILTLSTAIANLNPVYSVNTFTITGSIANNTSITFNLTFPQTYTATFIAKTYPDRSTYFLASLLTDETGFNIGSNSTTEIATSLAECLQQDSIISRMYFITNSGTTVTLQAREYGDKYNLDSNNVTISGSNITLSNTTSGLVRYDGQITSDYSLYTELYVDPNLQFGGTPVLANFKRVAELELPFNNTNVHLFDLSTVLKNFVSSPKISFDFTGFTTLGNMDTCYYCKYGEKYPLIENTNTKKKRYKGQTSVLYAINSALNFEDPNDMSGYLGNPISSGSTTYTGVTFMNVAPNPKFIQRGSKEFLYFLLNTNYPNYLKLKGDIYYYNGTSDTGLTFITITSSGNPINFGGVTVLAAGYDELGLSAYENSGNTKIRRIDFAVWQQHPTGGTETQLSETRSYLLEIDEQPQKFNVAFLNKLGTFETFSFVGEVVEDAEVVRQNYQVPYVVDSVGAAKPGFQYNGAYDTSYTKLWTVNSGTVDEDTYYYIQDMLASNRMYNYSDPHENFLTVVSQTTTKSSNQAEYTVQIQFKETIFENNVEK